MSVKNGVQVAQFMADPKVCVSLEATTVKEVMDEAARANLSGADIIEIRFDRLYLIKPQATISESEEGERISYTPPAVEWATRDFDSINVETSIESFKEGIPLPVIFTVRPVRDGGFFIGTEEQRLEILATAIASGVSWVDLETSIEEKARAGLLEAAKAADCQVIASTHSQSMPSAADISELIRTQKDLGDIIKFCGKVSNHQDALQIVEASQDLADDEVQFSLMGLGNGGDWARIHAPVLSQTLVFATMLNEFRLNEKGLVNVNDLRDAWTLLEY